MTEPATDEQLRVAYDNLLWKALESRKRFLEIHGVRTTAEAWERELIARIEDETRAAALSRELRLHAEDDLEAEKARADSNESLYFEKMETADERKRKIHALEEQWSGSLERIAELEARLKIPCPGCPGCATGDCPDARDFWESARGEGGA